MTAIIVGGVYLLSMAIELFGEEREPGVIRGAALPSVLVQTREAEQQAVAQGMKAGTDKQILFGDLHVHTTNSTDAFLWSLPIYGGEGAHPPRKEGTGGEVSYAGYGRPRAEHTAVALCDAKDGRRLRSQVLAYLISLHARLG